MSKFINKRNILTVLFVLVIWGHSMVPAKASSKESGVIFNFIHSIFPFVTHYMIRKTAHFCEYMLLGILIEKKSYVVSALLCLLVAVIDEFIQYFSPGRVSSLIDVGIDFLGAMCGIIICIIYRKIKICKRK